MQQGRLSGIIKTEEEKLGVLVEKTQRSQKVVDWSTDSENQQNKLIKLRSDRSNRIGMDYQVPSRKQDKKQDQLKKSRRTTYTSW